HAGLRPAHAWPPWGRPGPPRHLENQENTQTAVTAFRKYEAPSPTLSEQGDPPRDRRYQEDRYPGRRLHWDHPQGRGAHWDHLQDHSQQEDRYPGRRAHWDHPQGRGAHWDHP